MDCPTQDSIVTAMAFLTVVTSAVGAVVGDWLAVASAVGAAVVGDTVVGGDDGAGVPTQLLPLLALAAYSAAVLLRTPSSLGGTPRLKIAAAAQRKRATPTPSVTAWRCDRMPPLTPAYGRRKALARGTAPSWRMPPRSGPRLGSFGTSSAHQNKNPEKRLYCPRVLPPVTL